ncbi:MAG: hypothetical protein IKR34_04265 [Candidatus Gastranaerophilales bacterium]|nr:hypothetical protein [Candidatus Gastranaerophilales bacterium]
MEQMSPILKARIEQQQAINTVNQNNTQYIDLTQKPDTFELNTKKEENKKGKIAKIIVTIAAITAAVAGIIYANNKNKSADIVKQLSDIKFDKGIATLKEGGENFSGKITDTLKNGDKIVLEYTDGILQKTTRSGGVNFEKVYETINNEKIVKKTEGGVTTEFNITKVQEEAKNAQEKLKDILNNKTLSSDELKKQTDAIKFKSKNQKKEIENAINSKEKAEADLKAKLEAEQKARAEAERIANEKAEELAETNIIDLSKIEPQKQFRPLGYTLKEECEEFPVDNPKKEIAYLEKLKSVSVDESSKLGNYEDTPYDMPLKFMASTNEQLAKTGSALIVDEVPEMFKGIEQSELQKAIDNLGSVLDSKKINKFEIAGKKFTAEYIGSGIIGKVYKISDEQGHSVAIKFFKDPTLIGLQGAYAEIPIARQASKEGVIDVAKFYMANPCGRFTTTDGFCPDVNIGGWQMVEFLEDTTPLKNNGKGKKFFGWLKDHGLTFGDFNAGTMKGEYVVDVGGVIHPKKMYDGYFVHKGDSAADKLLFGYMKNETLDDVIKVISEQIPV